MGPVIAIGDRLGNLLLHVAERARLCIVWYPEGFISLALHYDHSPASQSRTHGPPVMNLYYQMLNIWFKIYYYSEGDTAGHG